ncbi:hypothetical protein R5W24_006561 [Gemmata sp. JC717]|uniref:hypothetical protein n=1 Tax=Gemmata algarum TaxID=2975278 RepID=UPI0021BBA4B4|nr:hypothetical protein [Gemmata algarum]MDY3557371.1 hypothetical protein [Gemmata algarum]
MRPWEFVALFGALLLVAFASFGPIRRAAPGSDERKAPLLVATLCCMAAVGVLVVMLVKFVF